MSITKMLSFMVSTVTTRSAVCFWLEEFVYQGLSSYDEKSGMKGKRLCFLTTGEKQSIEND